MVFPVTILPCFLENIFIHVQCWMPKVIYCTIFCLFVLFVCLFVCFKMVHFLSVHYHATLNHIFSTSVFHICICKLLCVSLVKCIRWISPGRLSAYVSFSSRTGISQEHSKHWLECSFLKFISGVKKIICWYKSIRFYLDTSTFEPHNNFFTLHKTQQ